MVKFMGYSEINVTTFISVQCFFVSHLVNFEAARFDLRATIMLQNREYRSRRNFGSSIKKNITMLGTFSGLTICRATWPYTIVSYTVAPLLLYCTYHEFSTQPDLLNHKRKSKLEKPWLLPANYQTKTWWWLNGKSSSWICISKVLI